MQRYRTIRTVVLAFIFLVAGWCIPPALLAAQDTTFTLFRPTYSNVPFATRAYYKAYTRVSADSTKAIANITAADFDVTENGVPIPAASITHNCFLNDSPALSVVLIIDKGGSMGEYINPPDTLTRFDVVKAAMKSFISTVKFVSATSVAIVSFDAIAYLEKDFTNDKGALYKSIDNITLGGDRRYNYPLLDSTRGAIPLLSRRAPYPVKRAVIYLTDGQPNKIDSIRRDSIMRGLIGTDVRFFGIMAWTEMHPTTAEFADVTGGKSYSVTTGDTKAQLISIYKEIARFLQQQQNECYIQWTPRVSCTENATANVVFKKTSTPQITERTYPTGYVFQVTFQPQKLDFGNPPNGQPVIKQLSIQSNVDVTVTVPTITTSCGTVTLTSWNSPETFKAYESRKFEVVYQPTSETKSCTGTLTFSGTPCNLPIVELQAGAPSGVDDYTENGTAFTVWPMPASDVADVMLPLTTPSQVRIELLAPNGRTLHTLHIEGNAGMNRFTLPLADIPSGVYAVRLQTGSFAAVQKIVVVK